MIKKGLIVSVQCYSAATNQELAIQAVKAGAVAIRTDKSIVVTTPVIGLHKISVENPIKQAYITPTVEDIKKVQAWADYIAIDYRRLNPNLEEISEYAYENKLQVVADITNYDDYVNIRDKKLYYTYIATTFSAFEKNKIVSRYQFTPDIDLIKKLTFSGCRSIIGEGGFQKRHQVREAYAAGASNVCIGGAISDIYKLTKKFVVEET
jgi:putative N-acetylmannosamine-6-phosphate epimerase